jgi:hypothetical protein
MRFRWMTIAIVIALFAGTPHSFAADVNDTYPIAVLVNYNKVQFPDNFPPYITADGRTMVPVRGVFEEMHAVVTWGWNEAKKIVVTASHNGDEVVLAVGEPHAKVNGRTIALDAPPEIRNNRMCVPLRFLSEAFGGEVTWVPRSESGHPFDYIRIDGQFRFEEKRVEWVPKFHTVGYGEPIPVASFPIVITGKEVRLTIHNITNSGEVYHAPNSNILLSRMDIAPGNPYLGPFNAREEMSRLGMYMLLHYALIRLEVEIEALTSNGFQYDEMTILNNIFQTESHSDFNNTNFASTVYSQINSNPPRWPPEKFSGFVKPKLLSEGEKLKTIVPLRYYLSASKPNVTIKMNMRSRGLPEMISFDYLPSPIK